MINQEEKLTYDIKKVNFVHQKDNEEESINENKSKNKIIHFIDDTKSEYILYLKNDYRIRTTVGSLFGEKKDTEEFKNNLKSNEYWDSVDGISLKKRLEDLFLHNRSIYIGYCKNFFFAFKIVDVLKEELRKLQLKNKKFKIVKVIISNIDFEGVLHPLNDEINFKYEKSDTINDITDVPCEYNVKYNKILEDEIDFKSISERDRVSKFLASKITETIFDKLEEKNKNLNPQDENFNENDKTKVELECCIS